MIWSFCSCIKCNNIIYKCFTEGACDASNGSSFRAVTYEFDGTRPVRNHDGNLKLNEQMDVQGFSHKSRQVFEKHHALHPAKPMFASAVVLASQNEKKRTRATVPGAQRGNPTQAMASPISQAR